MQGGAVGAAWYVWYYAIMCTHSNHSLSRFLLAHAFFGGALTAVMFAPGVFPYGFFFGLFLGRLPS